MNFRNIFLILIIQAAASLHGMEAPAPTIPNQELLEAAKNGDIVAADHALNAGAQINTQERDEAQAIHHAAAGGHLPMVRWLIEHGASVNAVDNLGETPLHYALKNNQFDVAKLLIEYGANVNSTNFFGIHPLCSTESPDFMRHLIERGAQPTEEDAPKINKIFSEPLLLAIALRHEQDIEHLLGLLQAHELSPSEQALINDALQLAAQQNQEFLVRDILDKFPMAIDDASLQAALIGGAYSDNQFIIASIYEFIVNNRPIGTLQEAEWEEALSKALYISGIRRNIPLVTFILNTAFTQGLSLDLTPLGEYITNLLRMHQTLASNSPLTASEVKQYTALRNLLLDAIEVRKASRVATPQMALPQLPLELIYFILSFLRAPSKGYKG